MLVALQSLLLLKDSAESTVTQLHWKTSALRTFLATTLLLSGIMNVHLLAVATDAGITPVIVTVLVFFSAGLFMWQLSFSRPRLAAILLTVAAYASGATMILFNSLTEVMRIGAIFICVAPLFCWTFFGWRVTLACMLFNTLPFVFVLSQPAPIMLFGIDLAMPYSIEYVYATVFMFFNFSIPLVLLRVRSALDKTMGHHSQALERLREQHQIYQSMFTHATHAQLICTETGNIESANPSACALLGRDPVGQSLQTLLRATANAETLYPFSDTPHTLSGDFACQRANAAAVWLNVATTPLAAFGRYLITLTDVSALRAATAEQARHAWRASFLEQHDVLTGLPNQVEFAHHVGEYCTARQSGRIGAGLVIFLRLNNIRQINDRYGLEIGNQTIRRLAESLVSAAGAEAYVARLRGMVFGCLRTTQANDTTPHQQLDALTSALPQSFEIDGHVVIPAYSLGVVIDDQETHACHDLLRLAERTLNEARNLPGNAVMLLTPELKHRIRRETQLEALLPDALATGELQVFYQPKVTITGNIDCAEALLRWHSPQLGQVSPAEFIPLAERNGFIPRITRHVINVVCQQLHEWQKQGMDVVPIAINLSGQDLLDGTVVAVLQAALAANQLPSGLVQLEITETALIENEALAVRQLRALHQEGIELALDDFGTGHSSLSKLSEYPISTIKIDREFIDGIGHAGRREQIVKATLSLARSLGCKSVAEGVETAEQFAFLAAHGCDLYQGYHFHRPVDATAFVALLGRIGMVPGG